MRERGISPLWRSSLSAMGSTTSRANARASACSIARLSVSHGDSSSGGVGCLRSDIVMRSRFLKRLSERLLYRELASLTNLAPREIADIKRSRIRFLLPYAEPIGHNAVAAGSLRPVVCLIGGVHQGLDRQLARQAFVKGSAVGNAGGGIRQRKRSEAFVRFTRQTIELPQTLLLKDECDPRLDKNRCDRVINKTWRRCSFNLRYNSPHILQSDIP